MKETITITYGEGAEILAASIAGSIADYLKAESVAGDADGISSPVSDPTLAYGVVRVQGDLQFDIGSAAIDGLSENLSTERTFDVYGFNTELVAVYERERSFVISKAYRDAIRGVANVGAQIESGAITVPAGTSQAKYLSDLAYAVVDAFPNTN